MKLCWADRAAVGWAILVFGALAFVGAFGDEVPSPASNAWHAFLVFVLPPWVVLRVVDFVIGGPAKRRGQFRVSVER